MLRYILDRLREPSTFSGFSAFLAGLGLFGLTPADWNTIIGAIVAVAGAIGVFVGEKK